MVQQHGQMDSRPEIDTHAYVFGVMLLVFLAMFSLREIFKIFNQVGVGTWSGALWVGVVHHG